MDSFFSGQTAQNKGKQNKIKYILYKCILERRARAERDFGEQLVQCSLNFNLRWVI